MASSTVIRIDAEVLAELQRLAQPLKDTPNSVLRRVFGLPQENTRADKRNPRVAKLLESVKDLVGEKVQLQPHEKGYLVLSRTEKVVGYIQPYKEWLKVVARKGEAQEVGINNWEKERQDRLLGGPSVRWYIWDGDDPAYDRVAAVLGKLWNIR